MSGTAYLLTLTAADVKMIARVGGSHYWSFSLGSLVAGDNVLTDAEAKHIKFGIDQDIACGSDAAYPELPRDSTLCTKLHNLYQSII